MNKISESLLNSIDLIIANRLKTLNFDRTIKCYINTIINKSKGEYRVSYMDTYFNAYSLDVTKEYSISDCVYVCIPENNFANKKIILGLCC
jgi:hypothetical protein